MFGRLPAEVVAEATAGELGRLEAVHRSRRFLPWPVVWTLTGVAAVAALLAGGARHGLLAIGLVPLILLAMGGYTYLPPAGGRRWAALYEHGMVLASPEQRWVRAIRWVDLLAVDHGPGGTGLRLTVAPNSPRGPAPGWFAAFGEPDAVAAGINRHVQPRAEAPGGALVAADLAAEQRRSRLRRQRSIAGLATVGLLPALAYPVFATVSPRTVVADGPIRAAATTATRTPSAPSPATSMPTPLPTPTTAPAIPDSIIGYDEVCRGAKFRGAPAYTGRGPHLIEFADMTPPGPGAGFDTDPGLSNIPFTWKNIDPTIVQLVACVTRTLGHAARHCQYDELGGDLTVVEPLLWADYAIVLRAARTGEQVARFRVRGRGTECLPFVRTGGGPLGHTGAQYTSLSLEQMISLFGRYVDDRFGR